MKKHTLKKSMLNVSKKMTPAIQLLQQKRIPFDTLSYEHQAGDEGYATEASVKLNLEPASVFKTLVVECAGKQGSEYCVAIVPSTHQLSMKKVAKSRAAKKAQMADAKKVEAMTGYLLGGVSPFGQKKRLKTLLDESALAFDKIYVSAGRRGLEIKIAPQDLLDVLSAVSIDVLAD